MSLQRCDRENVRCSGTKQGEGEPLLKTPGDEVHSRAPSNGSSRERIDRSRSSGRRSNCTSADALRQREGTAVGRVAQGEAEDQRSPEKCTAARARPAYEEGEVAAPTAHYYLSPEQTPCCRQARAAASSLPGSSSAVARSSSGTTEDTQNTSRSSRKANNANGGQQPPVVPCRSYPLMGKGESPTTTQGGSSVACSSTPGEFSDRCRSRSSKAVSTNSGADSRTCRGSSIEPVEEAIDPPTAETGEQGQVSPCGVAVRVDTSVGTSDMPQLQRARVSQQQAVTAATEQESAAGSSVQQQEASDALCCLVPPQKAVRVTLLQEAAGDSMGYRPESKTAQHSASTRRKEAREGSCSKTEEGIEQEQGALGSQEREDAEGTESCCRPLLQERKEADRSFHVDVCGSSRAVAAAAAVTEEPPTDTAARGHAFCEGGGPHTWAGRASLPSSSSLLAPITSPLIAEASQLATSRVERTRTSAAGDSGSSSSSRSRWLSLPICCCCWLRAWSARRERATARAPSTGVGTTDAAAAASERDRRAPNLCSGSHNVYLLLIISAFMTLFNVTAQGQLFDNWLFFLGNESTVWVGKAESISGLTSLVSAVPVGLAVDRIDRSKLCKLGAVLGVISSIIGSLGCWWSSWRLVIVSLVLCGATWELFTSAGSAIFTDTLDEFSRVYWFTIQGVVMTFCGAVGPGLMAAYFLVYGDRWEMPIMQRAIISSTLIFGVGGSLLFCGVRNPPRHTCRFSQVASEEADPVSACAAGARGGAVAPIAAERRGRDKAREQISVVGTGAEHYAIKSARRREERCSSLRAAADTQACSSDDAQGRQELPEAAMEDCETVREGGRWQEGQQQQQQMFSSGSAAPTRKRCGSKSMTYSSCSTQVPYSVVSSEAPDGRSGEDEESVPDSSSSVCGRRRPSTWWSNPSGRKTCAAGASSRGRRTSEGLAASCSSSSSNRRDSSSSQGTAVSPGLVLEGLLFGVRKNSSSRVAKAYSRVPGPTLPTDVIARASPVAGAVGATETSCPPSYYSALPSECTSSGPEERAAAAETRAAGDGLTRSFGKERGTGEATTSATDCTCGALGVRAAETGLLSPVHSREEATVAPAAECVSGGGARQVRTSRSSVLSLVEGCYSAGHAFLLSGSSSSGAANVGMCARQTEAAATPGARMAASPYPCCFAAAEAEQKPRHPSQQSAPQRLSRGSFSTTAAAPLLREPEEPAANPSVCAAHTGWATTHAMLDGPASSAAAAAHDQRHEDPAVPSHAATSSFPSSGTSAGTLPAEEWMNELTPAQRKIPYLVAASDAVRALGAGMTVKFFPIFFEEAYKFTPLQICYLASTLYISIGLFMLVGRGLASRLGRAGAASMLTFVGTCMLLTMVVARKVEVMVALYILRGALQNAAAPLTRSIVMDFTSTRNRGKWNAAQSFNSTLWSGSAFVGGFVADFDMRFAFFVTGTVYIVAWLIFLPVMCLLPEAEAKYR